MALNRCALHPVCRMPLGKECVTRVPFTDHNPGTLLAVRQRCLRLWVTRAKSDSPYFLDDIAVGEFPGAGEGKHGLDCRGGNMAQACRSIAYKGNRSRSFLIQSLLFGQTMLCSISFHLRLRNSS